MKVLLEVEAQTLAEGREWTRQRLEERLQAQTDQIEAVCPQSCLVLKYVRMREFSLMTCVGTVTVRAAYGFSSLLQRWLSLAREQWALTPYGCQPATTAEALLHRDPNRVLPESRTVG
jgi:hypothetical protein